MSSKLDQLFTHIEVLKSREHTKKNAENLVFFKFCLYYKNGFFDFEQEEKS